MAFESQLFKMYYLKILSVACIGLSIYGCNNNDSQQRAKEDNEDRQALWSKEYQQLVPLSADAV